STTLSANCASGTVSWFTDSNLSTSLSNTTVSPSVNTTYYVACVSGTCKSASANIVVLVSGTSLLPNLTSTSKTNACPSTVIDLSTITATNTPVGYSLTWHTGMPATLSNEISSISAVTSGSYYASFKNSGGCYGPTTLVSAYTTDCSSPLPPIPPVPATCSYATSPTNMVFNMSNEPSGLSKSYALIDMANAKIIQVNTSLPTFTNITTGVYYVVGIYYTGTIKNLEQGKQLSNVYIENLDGCLKYSEPLAVKVCGSCDYSTSPTNITFNGTASPTVGATTTYVLIDESTNTIAQLSSTTQFTNVQKGDYAVVAVFSSGTNSLAVGNNLAQELLKDSTCLSSSNALRFKVCAMPIANRDDAVVYSGEFLTIPVLNNDKNADNTVASLTKVSTPSITVNPSHGQITVNPDGTIKYSPTVGFIGLDSFVYSICDLTSATYCDTAMVSVQVLAPLNIKPIASNDIAVVLKGSQFTGNVLMNDYDPDGGTLTVSTIPVTAPSKGTVVLNPNGSYTYTPLAGATGYDSFCYKVCDNGTTSLCDTACVSINILESPLPINNKPIANDDNILVHGWSTVNINVKANDLDFEGNNTIGAPINVTNPSHGTLIANSNGFSYTPTNGYTGLDSFTYKICDNGTPSLCDTATVYINVTTQISGNNPPSAVDDAILVPQNIITVGNVSVNDSDIDNIPAQLSYTSVVQPTHGTLNLNTNGTFTYTPSSGFLGSDSFVYKVCDTNGGCDTATVYVSVYKNLDTDNDGISDANDLDDDNDGILDSVENSNSCSLASNVPDYLTDCDGDGIPNRIDLDSDNDGANDVIEANGTDSDGDGMADGVVSATGIPSSAGAGLTPPDTDNDTHANPYDLDSNNDGVFDLVEAGGLNPYLDADNNGIVDCLTNCDPDGDGILTPVDGLPNTWGDAFLPDLTPTTEINGLEFLNAGTAKDFVVNVFEVNNKPNLTGTTIGFRVAKLSGFTISYLTTSGTSSVFGGTSNSNSDWTFTENASFITVTAKPGVVIPPNGKKTVGFTATRKVGVPSNTSQNITVTIIYGSAGEERVDNNIVETKITAN
ncbi:tandem-95 repeat protein, partial [Emticicia sp. ODNR4P]|nr:tandem-95 repeat protein [Emticicia sp. ODNR4P]